MTFMIFWSRSGQTVEQTLPSSRFKIMVIDTSNFQKVTVSPSSSTATRCANVYLCMSVLGLRDGPSEGAGGIPESHRRACPAAQRWPVLQTGWSTTSTAHCPSFWLGTSITTGICPVICEFDYSWPDHSWLCTSLVKVEKNQWRETKAFENP